MAKQVDIVFGAGFLAQLTDEMTIKFLDTLEKKGVKQMDTAYIYTGSERRLGKHKASERFVIDTKAPGFTPGCLKGDNVVKAGQESLKRLETEQVNIYYLHSPDAATPIEETLEAVQKLYESGAFKYFGLSNYLPQDVERIYAHQKSKGWVLPTVYQGLYNPVARHVETTLFPVLRKLNITFYAYSPLAMGLLVKSPADLEAASTAGGKWDESTQLGKMLQRNYGGEDMKGALRKWDDVAKASGLEKGEIAYRWVRYHSALKAEHGDALIFGASRLEQLEQTVDWLQKGKLDTKVVKEVEAVWDIVKRDAPLDNYHGKPEDAGSKI